jgi:cobalt-zinc-cadmium resistance protein CzcA
VLEHIARWSLRNWLAVPFFALAVGLWGLWSFSNLTIEAFPDPTDPQVQIITQFPGQPTEEIERQIGLPLERALNGTPGLMRMRNISLFGLSNVTLTFKDGTDLLLARQLVLERLRDAELPEGVLPELGPLATPIGEVYRYTLTGANGDVLKLRQLQDWTVRPALLRVPGVADVVTFGGLSKEIHVMPAPSRLAAFDVSLEELEGALKKGSANASGGMLERGSEGFVISSQGLFTSTEDIANVGIKSRNGTPVLVRNVAEVTVSWAPRQGVASHGTERDVVEGTILMRRGENPTVVLQSVRDAIAALNARLPDGATILPFYDRTELVDQTLHTVIHNLIEGAVLVMLVLWVFLMDLKAAVIVGLLIPLSLLISFIYLYLRGMSANLLSMGAVDFGVIVDGGVVIIEAILMRLQHREPRQTVMGCLQEATDAVVRPTVFSLTIIIAAYLPIFLLQRVEGRIFAPMANTVVAALSGALLLSITLVPVLAWLFYQKRPPVHRESPVLRVVEKGYGPVLNWCLDHAAVVMLATALMVGVSVAVMPRLGSEFLPALNEGSLYVTFTMPQNISLHEGRRLMPRIYGILAGHPAVSDVLMQLGRPEDGTDPNLPNNLEMFIRLKRPDQWPAHIRSVDDLVAEMTPLVAQIPGADVTFSQPIADNVNDSISGQPGDIACKLYGSDLKQLQAIAEKWKDALSGVQGVADLGIVRSGMQPQLQIHPDRVAMTRFGIEMDDFQHFVQAALGGLETGVYWEGEIPVPVMLRFPKNARDEADKIRQLLIPIKGGRPVPLTLMARVENGFGRASIFRENGRRYIGLRMNVRGRDLGSFVTAARKAVLERAPLPPGVSAEWGGEFESKERAMNRLLTVVPVTLALTFVLLFGAFGNLLLAGLVLLTIPLALVGGVFGLLLMGMPVSVAAAVGFIALIGQASLNGVLILSAVKANLVAGLPVRQAIVAGCIDRLRPVMMTGCLAALGLLPAAMSRAMGSETQQPVAVVVVGGTLSAMALTLLVLPVMVGLLAKWTAGTRLDLAKTPTRGTGSLE